jgi:hypothetical protein
MRGVLLGLVVLLGVARVRASHHHPEGLLVAVTYTRLESDKLGSSRLAIGIYGLSHQATYTLHVAVAMPNQSNAFVETFEGARVVDSKDSRPLTSMALVYVYMGTNVLVPGLLNCVITLLDAHPRQTSEAVVAARSQTIACCPQNVEGHLSNSPHELQRPAHVSEDEQGRLQCSKSGICPTSSVKTVWGGVDGTLVHTASYPGYNWWSDPRVQHALHYYDLDQVYDETYHSYDHLNDMAVADYAASALMYCEVLLGKPCTQVLDAGAHRCYLSEGMQRLGAKVLSVEGTAAGVAACKARVGAIAGSVLQHDLRVPLKLSQHFDLVTCTEVAEHIEPPFAGTLVHTLTAAADVVWFSSEAPRWAHATGGNPDHIHHPNEQPDDFWDRLFLFFGFLPIALPIDGNAGLGGIGQGRRIYYRHSTVSFNRSTLTWPPKTDPSSPGVLYL